MRNRLFGVGYYLPKHGGLYWYDLNSNGVFEGGREIRYDAPLNKLPLFAKGDQLYHAIPPYNM